MKKYIKNAKNYIIKKNEMFIGIGIVAGLVTIVASVALFSGPNIVYKPVAACEMLTPTIAGVLLGSDAINSVDTNQPVIKDEKATSKCSYTNRNPDKDAMIVAAIAVQSGINDEGVAQNIRDFTTKKPKKGADTVKNLGDSAYFNRANGQLNILNGHDWVILSYGVGSTPQENPLDKSVELAHKVLH